MANLYMDEALPVSAFVPDSAIEIRGDEARHAVRVSRLRVGERTAVGNGAGVIGHGTVGEIAKDRFTVDIDEVRREAEPSMRLVLVQALAKGDRDERAVEQATEFGVDAVVPWEAERSVSRWARAEGGANRVARGVEKWRRLAREAAKQSMRAWIPEVREPIDIRALCASAERGGVLVLDPRGDRRLSDWSRERGGALAAGEVGELMVVVGPEGGLSSDELSRLASAGAPTLRLGGPVLRTSSAGPAAIAILNAAIGRW